MICSSDFEAQQPRIMAANRFAGAWMSIMAVAYNNGLTIAGGQQTMLARANDRLFGHLEDRWILVSRISRCGTRGEIFAAVRLGHHRRSQMTDQQALANVDMVRPLLDAACASLPLPHYHSEVLQVVLLAVPLHLSMARFRALREVLLDPPGRVAPPGARWNGHGNIFIDTVRWHQVRVVDLPDVVQAALLVPPRRLRAAALPFAPPAATALATAAAAAVPAAEAAGVEARWTETGWVLGARAADRQRRQAAENAAYEAAASLGRALAAQAADVAAADVARLREAAEEEAAAEAAAFAEATQAAADAAAVASLAAAQVAVAAAAEAEEERQRESAAAVIREAAEEERERWIAAANSHHAARRLREEESQRRSRAWDGRVPAGVLAPPGFPRGSAGAARAADRCPPAAAAHRGLTNASGEESCFLNVVVQSLARLRGFLAMAMALRAAEPHVVLELLQVGRATSGRGRGGGACNPAIDSHTGAVP
jgi:hypothetical protein